MYPNPFDNKKGIIGTNSYYKNVLKIDLSNDIDNIKKKVNSLNFDTIKLNLKSKEEEKIDHNEFNYN